jgi:hypothetical protein
LDVVTDPDTGEATLQEGPRSRELEPHEWHFGGLAACPPSEDRGIAGCADTPFSFLDPSVPE